MPKESKQDTLIVRNIDLNCHEIDSEYGYDHSEYFMVKYDGQPFKIRPGETRKMPRYVAEHFAKHLANHVLIKEEEASGGSKRGLMTSATRRPQVLKEILVGVDSWYNDDESFQSEGEKAAEIDQELNPEEKAMDLGVVDDPMMGKLTPDVKPIEEIIKASGVEDDQVVETSELPEKPTIDDRLNRMTKNELIRECDKLGETVTGRETNAELITLIKKMA